MTWTTIAILSISQDWQLTPNIAPDLGYVRLRFNSAIGSPVWVAQVDPSSPNDVYDERRIVATTSNRILEFETPPFFENRALALRAPNFTRPFSVEVQVSDVPFQSHGAAAPIPWEAPGAIGLDEPSTAKFTDIAIERNGIGTVQSFQSAPGDKPGYRFELLGDPNSPDLRLRSFTEGGQPFEAIFTSKLWGETQIHAPVRLTHPPVLPRLTQHTDYWYMSRGIFLITLNGETFLAYAFEGRLFRVAATEVPL